MAPDCPSRTSQAPRAIVIFRRALISIVVAALVLPMIALILVATGRLLAAMQDLSGSLVLDRLALVVGLLWIMVLVALVITQALDRLGPPSDPPSELLE